MDSPEDTPFNQHRASGGAAPPPHGGPPQPPHGAPQPEQQGSQAPYGPAGYGPAPGQPGQPPGQPPHAPYHPPAAGDGRRRGGSSALWWILGAAVLVLLLVVAGGGVAAYWLLSDSGQPSTADGNPPGGAGGDVEGVETFDDLSAEHTEDAVDYPMNPPVGGEHNPVWQDCGVYDEPLPPEHAVHSLEHGAVWIAYSADLPAGDVAALEELYRDGDYLLVSPEDALDDPVVAVAWGKRLAVDDPGDARLSDFLTAYMQGPQTLEPGAPCSSGNAAPEGSA